MSSLVDSMVGGIFGSKDSYLDYKMAPTLARMAEAKAEAEIKVDEARAKQIDMSTTFDTYREFARAAASIAKDLGGDLSGIDPDTMIQEMADKAGISLVKSSTTKTKTK